MADSPLGERSIPDPPTDEPRLESWGEIAAYLHREIRTVQRWERYQGLPVRRLQIGKLGTVYAYRSELDKWFRERQPKPENNDNEEDTDKPTNGESTADIKVLAEVAPEESEGESSRSEAPPPRPRGARLHITITILTLLIIAVATPTALFLRGGHSSVRSASGKIRLVVLPFANLSGDPQQDYFSAGLTDEMITQLGRLDPERLGVIAAETSKLSARKPISELGHALDVQYALEGSVRRGGNEVRINVQLIQVSDQTHIWANSYNGDVRDILHVQDEVASDVASQIRVALPVAALSEKAAAAHEVNPDAYEAYLRGRLYWTNRGDLHKGIAAYQQAIDKDPNFALAYAGIARSYALLGQVPYDDMPPIEAKPKAREAAEHALTLDPQLGEAHSVLANVSFSYDWDFDSAEREFQRALTLNRNDTTAHLWYSHYNMMRNHIPLALQENARTLDLDPVSPLFNTVRAEIYYNSRQYDLAIDQARHTIEQYPTYWLTYIWLGSAYREKKMYDEALQQFSEARKLSSDHPAIMALYGHTLGLAGDRPGARKTLADLHLLAQSRYVSSLYFAAVYTGLGEKSTALDWLEKAYKERNDRLLYLNVDPIADSLRAEPRFQALMKRLHLP